VQELSSLFSFLPHQPMEKGSADKVAYEGSSLENPDILRQVVDIHGGNPACRHRSAKYAPLTIGFLATVRPSQAETNRNMT
jgi:hypothetical protein